MNDDWHELIQRYVDGQAGAEEAAALQAALKEDAELRALYLDYMNLDIALGAAAEAEKITAGELLRLPSSVPAPSGSSAHHWQWLVGAAACVAVLVYAMMPQHHDHAQTRPDITTACSSAEEAISRLSVEPTTTIPAWASPTAFLLDQPRTPKWDLGS